MAELSLVVAGSEELTATQREQVLDLCSRAYNHDFSAYLRDIGPGTHLLGYVGDELVSHAIPPLVHAYDIAALSPAQCGLYARLGWELWKGPLAYVQDSRLIETPEEELMIRRLPRTPPTLDLSAKLVTDWRPGEVW